MDHTHLLHPVIKEIANQFDKQKTKSKFMWPNTGPLTNKFQELLDFINQYSTNPNESMQHLITEIVQQGNEALQKPLLTDKKIKIKINDWKRLQILNTYW